GGGAEEPAQFGIGSVESAIHGIGLKEGNLARRNSLDALPVEISTLAICTAKDEAFDPEVIAASPRIEPQPQRGIRCSVVVQSEQSLPVEGSGLVLKHAIAELSICHDSR